jgi:ABC-type Co2+ transport system permease subunit
MSHIHLPDGVLPTWLWVSGFAVAILVWIIFFRVNRQAVLAKRLPLLGMMAAR